MTDTVKVKPIFLLSDSHILFWNQDDKPFINRLREQLLKSEDADEDVVFRAAYIGASNDDNPDFYDIFTAAMQQIDITDCRLVPAEPSDDDLDFLASSDLILLAGGDVKKGWDVISEKFQKIIVERYYAGVLLVGVSAGAVQLGIKGWEEDGKRTDSLFDTLQLVPAVVDVHDEENDWDQLHEMVKHMGGYARGFGIPMGAAAVYHPDWSFEAYRHHLVEFSHVEKELKRSLILPDENGEYKEEETDDQRRIIKPEDIMKSGIDLPPGMDAEADVQVVQP